MRNPRSPFIVLSLVALLVTSLGTTASAAAPANDDWADAKRIWPRSLTFKHTGNNAEATTQVGEDTISTCGPDRGRSVWYRFKPPSDMAIRVVATGNFDISLRLMVGNSLDSLVDVRCSDRGTTGRREWLAHRLRKGYNYYLRIDSGYRAGGFGDHTLRVMRQRPRNDFIRDAITVKRFPFENRGWNRYATIEWGSPFGTRGLEPTSSFDFDCDGPVPDATRTVWYKIKPAKRLPVRAVLKGRFNLRMTLFVGNSPSQLKELDCNADISAGENRVALLRTLRPGNKYWFQVASAGEAWGKYTFKVAKR